MKYTMIGVDLAKNVFQLHGASLTGEVRFRRKLSRGQFLRFMGSQPACIVVMEACGSAHHWAREMAGAGPRSQADRAAICATIREAPEE